MVCCGGAGAPGWGGKVGRRGWGDGGGGGGEGRREGEIVPQCREMAAW